MERQRQSYFSNGPSNDANEKVRVLIRKNCCTQWKYEILGTIIICKEFNILMKVDDGKYMQIEKSVNQVIILALNACILQHDNLFLQFYHI